MKPRSRYRLLLTMAVVGALLSWGAWKGVIEEDPNNQGGVALALLGILVLLCIYGATGLHGLIGKLRSNRRN